MAGELAFKEEAFRCGLIIQGYPLVPLVEPFQVRRVVSYLAVDHLP